MPLTRDQRPPKYSPMEILIGGEISDMGSLSMPTRDSVSIQDMINLADNIGGIGGVKAISSMASGLLGLLLSEEYDGY